MFNVYRRVDRSGEVGFHVTTSSPEDLQIEDDGQHSRIELVDSFEFESEAIGFACELANELGVA